MQALDEGHGRKATGRSRIELRISPTDSIGGRFLEGGHEKIKVELDATAEKSR